MKLKRKERIARLPNPNAKFIQEMKKRQEARRQETIKTGKIPSLPRRSRK